MTDLLERAAKRRRKPNGVRWATLNQFVDLAMANLTPAQTTVWLYLFRHERGGTVETSTRQIAKGTGLSLYGTQLAMKALTGAGLLGAVKLSKSHNIASIYRLNPTTSGNTERKRPCN